MSEERSSDAEVGRAARELTQAIQDAVALVAVDAPGDTLNKQATVVLAAAERLLRLCDADPQELMEVAISKSARLYELVFAAGAGSFFGAGQGDPPAGDGV